MGTLPIPGAEVTHLAEEGGEGCCASIINFLLSCFCCGSSAPIESEVTIKETSDEERIASFTIFVTNLKDNVVNRPYDFAILALPPEYGQMTRFDVIRILKDECKTRNIEYALPPRYY